jgi:ribosomal-protein-alanine N-acetyltransferase
VKLEDVCFRYMQEADLNDVLKIEQESFLSPWSKFYFIHELNFNDNALLILMTKRIKYEEVIIGYTDLWKEDDCFHMANFAINPLYRKQGYGVKFLFFLMEYSYHMNILSMKLEVRVSNNAAINLYKKAGFHAIALLPGYYYDNNEDGYLMIADVEKSKNILKNYI